MKKQDCSADDVIRLSKSGRKLSDIRRITGVPESTASRWLRKADKSYGVKTRRWQPRRRRAFIRYLKGHSLRAISRHEGVSAPCVHYWFRAMNTDYVRISSQGVFASSRDHFAKRKPSKRSEDFEEWLFSNLRELIESESASQKRSFTKAEEKRLRLGECGRLRDCRSYTRVSRARGRRCYPHRNQSS